MRAITELIYRGVGERLIAERERWALWIPVAMGAGVALYFSLAAEPPLWAGLAAAGISLVLLLLLARHPAGRALAIGLLAASAGFSAAELRTQLVAAPILEQKLASVRLEGRVLDVECLPG